MQTKLKVTMVLLCGFVLLAVAACGASDERARISELETELEAEKEAHKEDEQRADEAEEDADEAIEERDEARDERDDAVAERDDVREDLQDEQQENQDLQEDLDQTQEKLTDAQQAELRARASSFGAQLDLGDGTAGPTAPTAVSAMADVEWTRGSSLTFRPQGVVMSRGSAPPSVPGGWRSASFTGQTGTAATLTDETVYLYTNIQAPGTRAFWKKYGGNDPDVSQTEVASRLAKPSTSVSRTRTDPNDPSSSFASATTGGTYDSVGGKFSCDGDETACTVTRTDGTTTIGGPWTFKATNLNSGAPVNQDDAYLYFGIWSSIPDSISGETYDFRYIAGGGAATGSALSGFDTLTGSATFRGGAVGKYVTQGQVGGQNAKIGTFTATATLNADFGAADAAGTLSGSITELRENGRLLEGWQVTLGSGTDVGVASTIADAAATGSTVANIGGLAVGGSWGASFYGSANVITGLEDREKYPAVDLAGVAGWFDATSTSASLAGAFAATPGN